MMVGFDLAIAWLWVGFDLAIAWLWVQALGNLN